MPQLSAQISTINAGGSDGWDLYHRARAMVASGEAVVELTIGEHDIGTDPSILHAMHKAAKRGATGYAETQGIPALRAAIAHRLSERTGVATSPDQILVTAGGQAALYAAHVAAVAGGAAGLYLEPFYATYPATIRAAGGKAVAVPCAAADGFLPDPDRLHDTAQRENARSLLINTPNNPTGRVYPAATLEAIASVAKDADLWLISDEVYDGQVWEGEHLSPRALPGMAERTMVVGSMSKSFAMTGSRLGWIAAPEPVIQSLTDLATNTTYGVPGYIQEAALFALEKGDSLEGRIRHPFERRRDLALDVLEEQSLITCLPPEGAMYVMLDVSGTGMDGKTFANLLLDQEKIAVMPGESFGPSACDFVRVALTIPDLHLEDALRRLCRFAAAQAQAA